MNSDDTTTNGFNSLENKDTLTEYQKQYKSLLKGLRFCEPVPGDLLIRINERLCKNTYTILR